MGLRPIARPYSIQRIEYYITVVALKKKKLVLVLVLVLVIGS